jgi:hypothetical protein
MLGAPFAELMLREQRVKLNLVDSRNDGPSLFKLLKIRDRPVGYTNSLDLACLVELFHLVPCLILIPRAVDSAGAIRVDREQRVRIVLWSRLVHRSRLL